MEVDKKNLDIVIKKLAGKSLEELMAAGRCKLFDMSHKEPIVAGSSKLADKSLEKHFAFDSFKIVEKSIKEIIANDSFTLVGKSLEELMAPDSSNLVNKFPEELIANGSSKLADKSPQDGNCKLAVKSTEEHSNALEESIVAVGELKTAPEEQIINLEKLIATESSQLPATPSGIYKDNS